MTRSDFMSHRDGFIRAERIKFDITDGIVAFSAAEFEAQVIERVRQAETRMLEQAHRPPAWLSVPVQIGACMLFGLDILAIGLGFVGLCAIGFILEIIGAVCRCVRWALC